MPRILNLEELQKGLPSNDVETLNKAFVKKLVDWVSLHDSCREQLDAKFAEVYSSTFSPEFGEAFPQLYGRIVFELSLEDQIKLKAACCGRNVSSYKSAFNDYKQSRESLIDDEKIHNFIRDREVASDAKILFNSKYFVISTNPMDYIFCSTFQNYSSCCSLNSPHNSKWGALGFARQKNMHICFFSNSLNYSKEEYAGLKVRPMKLATRAYLYSLENNEYGMGKLYPKSYSNLQYVTKYTASLISEIIGKNIDNAAIISPSFKALKYPYNLTFNKNGHFMEPYFDDLKSQNSKDNYFINKKFLQGSNAPNFNLDLEKIEKFAPEQFKFASENGSGDNFCFYGGVLKQGVRSDASFDSMMKQFDSLLSMYPICKHCGKMLTSTNDSRNVGTCQECLDKLYFKCIACGKWELITSATPPEEMAVKMCSSCATQYTVCSNCGQVICRDDKNNPKHLCNSCNFVKSETQRCLICNTPLQTGDVTICNHCLTYITNAGRRPSAVATAV